MGPVPGRNKIFRGSGVLTRAVESRRWRRRRAHWISDALRDRWSLGELARHWDPSQIRYSAGLGGGGGESRTVTAVKTSPHPTTSPNPAAGGGISATRPRFYRQWAAQEAGDGGGGCSSPVALVQAFLYLSLSVPLSRSLLLSLSLCFSDRWMSGPGAWCLVMISPSRLKALAEQSRGERWEEEERHRLPLAANNLNESPFFFLFSFFFFSKPPPNSQGFLPWDCSHTGTVLF